MARSVSIVLATLCLLVQFRFFAATQYMNDDTDYDYLDYKDLPEKRSVNRKVQDDFYMAGEPEVKEERNRRVADYNNREETDVSSCDATEAPVKWSPPERVYRYTKHRIPGYDYEELEFLQSRTRYDQCDERSVWTHCLCQFTCAQPNMVDCYTPCDSGCECREDYVFDEKTGECVLPEQCQPEEDYMLY